MLWKRDDLGCYSAKSGKCRAGITRDGVTWFWQVTREGGGTSGGMQPTLRNAKAAAEHAAANLNLLDSAAR